MTKYKRFFFSLLKAKVMIRYCGAGRSGSTTYYKYSTKAGRDKLKYMITSFLHHMPNDMTLFENRL